MTDEKYKIGKRTAARVVAVQGLYMMENANKGVLSTLETLQEMVEQGMIPSIEIRFCDFSFIEVLLKGVLEQQEVIDKKIIATLPETWSLKKINTVTRAMLRVGLYEILFMPETPRKIILTEYMNLSSAFGLNYDKDMVGGLLNKVVHEDSVE